MQQLGYFAYESIPKDGMSIILMMDYNRCALLMPKFFTALNSTYFFIVHSLL